MNLYNIYRFLSLFYVYYIDLKVKILYSKLNIIIINNINKLYRELQSKSTVFLNSLNKLYTHIYIYIILITFQGLLLILILFY